MYEMNKILLLDIEKNDVIIKKKKAIKRNYINVIVVLMM